MHVCILLPSIYQLIATQIIAISSLRRASGYRALSGRELFTIGQEDREKCNSGSTNTTPRKEEVAVKTHFTLKHNNYKAWEILQEVKAWKRNVNMMPHNDVWRQ